MDTKDVIISGGGASGLALASILGGYGLSVVVIEKNDISSIDTLSEGSRSAALMSVSLEILEAAGIKQEVEKNGCPFKKIMLLDEGRGSEDSLIETEFSSEDADFDSFGVNIPNNRLLQILYSKVSLMKNVQLVSQAELTSFVVGDASVSVSVRREGQKDSVEEFKAALLVGADGAGSSVRRMAGLGCHERSYDQTAICVSVWHSFNHNETSYEIHRQGGPFAVIPLVRDGHGSSIVWVERSKDAEAIAALDEEKFLKRLEEASHGVIGEAKIKEAPETYPLRYIRAKKIVAKRVALVAEAAHVMSPIGAQGLNLSLRDVFVLAKLIKKQKDLGLDLGSFLMLGEYQDKRRADILSRTYAVDTLNRTVRTDNPLIMGARRGAIRILDRMGFFKKPLMKAGLNFRL